MPCLIRKASAADAEALARLIEEFNEPYKPIQLTTEQIELRLRRCAPTEPTFIAYVDDQAAGFACVRLTPHMSGDDIYAELTDLFVTPAFRRQGVATALMKEVEAAAHHAGASDIVVITGFDSIEAKELYSRCGYQEWALAMKRTLSE